METEIKPQRFTRIAATIEATQFLEGKPIPEGVCFGWGCGGDAGCAHVHTIHAGQSVRITFGDWIIPESDGEHYYPCKDVVFKTSYMPVGSETR